MEHLLEAQVLDLQEHGIRLYGNLAEFYHWLGSPRMSRVLKEKMQTAVDDNLTTRNDFVDKFGVMVHHKLNIRVPQPWDKLFMMRLTGQAPQDEQEKDRLHHAALGYWLSYEQMAADLYRSLYASSKNSWHKELMHQALLEVERIKNSFPQNKCAMAS